MPGSAHRARGVFQKAGEPGAPQPGAPAPLVLFEKSEGALRLTAVCEAARRLGLSPGLGLAEARARFPGLEALESDPAADRKLLEAIADWCERWTPLVALDGGDGLILDISGCAHLFGGERAMLEAVLAGLTTQGFAVQGAIAAGAATARALARHAPGTLLEAGGEAEAMAPLPVAALDFDASTHALLGRLGLKRLGEIMALPRSGLVKRFGPALARRLDEICARAERPIGPRRAPPLLIRERRLFEPIARQEDILEVAAILATRLCADLEVRGEGARRLEFSLFRVDGAVERWSVPLSRPVRDPERLTRLIREKLKRGEDEREMGFGYDLVQLTVQAADPLAETQGSLAAEAEAGEPVEALLDRLSARLGEIAIFELQAVESHLPERAEIRRGLAEAGPTPMSQEPRPGAVVPLAPRPLRLLDPPERVEATAEVPEGAPGQFRWRRALCRVRRVEGPERIGGEWWHEDPDAPRDYWRVEDEEGRRYWLFREGRYQNGEAPPAWYLHGLFA